MRLRVSAKTMLTGAPVWSTISATKGLSAEKDMEYYEAYYNNVMIPECIGRTHPKGAITKRNRWMVEACDLFICYVEREDGGAYTAMKYAKKLEKKVINLAKIEEDQEDLLTTHI